jgi:hypothetical protein
MSTKCPKQFGHLPRELLCLRIKQLLPQSQSYLVKSLTQFFPLYFNIHELKNTNKYYVCTK